MLIRISKVMLKFSLYAMKSQREVDAQLQSFLTSTLDVEEFSVSCFGRRLTPVIEVATHFIGGWWSSGPITDFK
jgi:hypothetical protein